MIGSKRVLIAAFLLSTSFCAHAETTYTFASVTKIEHRSSGITINGVLVGGTTPTTVTLPASTDRCVSFYNMLISTPGAYSLAVTTDVQQDSHGNPINVFIGCSLESVP
jgi:hypothetical protein